MADGYWAGPPAPSVPPPTSQTKRFSVAAPAAAAAASPQLLGHGSGGAHRSSCPALPAAPTAARTYQQHPPPAAPPPAPPGGGGCWRGGGGGADPSGGYAPFADRPSTTGPPLRARGSLGPGGGGRDGTPDLLRTLPGRIQDSLKMFEELQSQRATLLSQDSNRIAAARTPQATPPLGSSGRAASVGRRPSGGGQQHGEPPLSRGEREREARREREAQQRKLHVAEQVMKKLHKKNQRLAREVVQLKEENDRLRRSGGGGDPPADASEEVRRLQRLLSERDRSVESLSLRVEALEEQARQRQADGGADRGAGRDAAEAAANAAQLTQLRAQYQELLDCRLETVAGGGSTAKVNKEVKQFFLALRRKVHDDLFERETARQVWNQRMLELEDELCDAHAERRLRQLRDEEGG